MDSFETARRAARGLHDVVVAGGGDPHSPEALITGAVKHLDLELVYLPSKDPALSQARALFDEQSGTICCEETSVPADRALLVAHEVGHVLLHSGSLKCHAGEIDPSRSIEAAPVGLQRVEDYGARERRELQADVFAREFVLPRQVVRDLHVDQGLGAKPISELTGLPLSLVRQQLLDALFLPEPRREPTKHSRSVLPDSSQVLAAGHRGAPFQLQAGPGTGKTLTLVQRVLSLLADGVDAGAVLVLTFSNRAAGELAARLDSAAPDAAPRIWIGTIHAFGLDLIKRYHDRLGLPSNPMLLDRSDAIEVLQEVLPTLPLTHYRNLWDPVLVLRDIVTAISRAKDELATPARYRALAEGMLASAASSDDRIAAEKCLEIAKIYGVYEEALARHEGVDFGDLVMRPALLLESDRALAQAVGLRHRHVLVDEYQDVNRASARLLRVVAGDGKRLWVVGDYRQSIYRFRGASTANMILFGTDYPGAVSGKLDVNYRSTKQIADLLTAVARRMGASEGMLRLHLMAKRGLGSDIPQIRTLDTPDDEIAAVAASVQELQREGVPLDAQAVLCRSNARLNEYAAGLEARGIPVLHLGSLFERSEIRDLLTLLSLAAGNVEDSLVRVAAMPRYKASLQDTQAAICHLRSMDDRPLNVLKAIPEAAQMSEQGVAAFRRLAQDVVDLDPHASPWDYLCSYILDHTDVARQMARATTVTDHMRAIAVWQFLNFLRVQSPVRSVSRIRRTLDRVRQLVLLAEERDLRQVPAAALHLDAVRLMTVHGSKGLEFEAVHVPGLTVASFPTAYRGQRCRPPAGMIESLPAPSVKEEEKRSHEHEEQSLFFVALSRAKSHLRLFLSRTQPNGNRRSASGFLKWLPPSLVDEVAEPTVLRLPAGGVQEAKVDVERQRDWTITASKLSTYEKCPRRFFYTHVLGLRSARQRTAFSQTHDCLYELIAWLTDAEGRKERSAPDLEKKFQEIWVRKGPIKHAFAADYRAIASRMIGTLARNTALRVSRHSEPLVVDLPKGQVFVEPDGVLTLPDKTVALRRIRTGYRRTNEYDRLDYALYELAAKAHFGTTAGVQVLHLTDGVDEAMTVTPRKLERRRSKSSEMLADIDAGRFPANPDPVTCPRCPHFFVCPTVPKGTLTLS